MVDQEKAYNWALQFDGEVALRDAVRDRLVDGDVTGLSFGKIDEHPEDIIVALFQTLPTGDDHLNAIVSGWVEARRRVDPVLENIACDDIPSDAFSRVFCIAERTGHDRLRAGVFSDLQLVIGDSEIKPIYTQQIVAAATVYEPAESDRALWIPALEIEDIAAYAFQALLKIKAERTRISKYLQQLILRQYRDKWDIDVWFISEFARTAFGSDKDVLAALFEIHEDHIEIWEKIKKDAPRNVCWSDQWIGEVELLSICRDILGTDDELPVSSDLRDKLDKLRDIPVGEKLSEAVRA